VTAGVLNTGGTLSLTQSINTGGLTRKVDCSLLALTKLIPTEVNTQGMTFTEKRNQLFVL